MAKAKKKVYWVTYAPSNKESLVSQGYSSFSMRRHRMRIKAYTDDQALALANLRSWSNTIHKESLDVTVMVSATVQYKVEKLVEVIQRPVEI